MFNCNMSQMLYPLVSQIGPMAINLNLYLWVHGITSTISFPCAGPSERHGGGAAQVGGEQVGQAPVQVTTCERGCWKT